jgi:eukaryotic-like serine/threonine-protein kinase
VLTLSALSIARSPTRRPREMWIYAIGNAALIAMMTQLCGPFVFVPALACVIAYSIVSYPVFANYTWHLVAIVITGWVLPTGLEVVGLIPSTWSVEHGAFVVRSQTIAIDGDSTAAVIFAVTLATIAIAGLVAGSLARVSHQAQRQLVVQKWQLSHLLPASKRARE